MNEKVFQEMVDRWKSPIVARTEIAVFSGGMMKEKYCSNLDSAGLGCPGRFRIGRKVCYPTKNLAEWLASRSTVISDRQRSGK